MVFSTDQIFKMYFNHKILNKNDTQGKKRLEVV